jgi:hypothetical protein
MRARRQGAGRAGRARHAHGGRRVRDARRDHDNRLALTLLLLAACAACAPPQPAPQPAAQNPSPMVDTTRRAAAGRATFVLTHSTIFPGTFASTTETADWLIARLALTRAAVLRWGPLGMQQLSDVCAGRLRVQGFAGHTAPDHVDHLHGLGHFLALHDATAAAAVDACG